MLYEFDWDPAKARSKHAKHGIFFEDAMTIFMDRLALTPFDEDHSDDEERWVTIGENARGQLLVVVHTFVEVGNERVVIRIISSRRPTSREARDYRESQKS